MNIPYFSIIIPTYNRGPELLSNVKKILQQTFTNFELIVVDDGSQDDTQKLISTITNEKLKYFKTENRERAHARNFGLKQAKGQYVNFFDSDDVMYADRLQQVSDWIEKNNHPTVLFTYYHFVDSRGRKIGNTERFFKSFTKDLLFNNFLATGSVFLKLDAARNNPFNETRKLITAEDWELWLRVHIQHSFHECPLVTFGITQHEGRSLRTISAERVKERDLYFIEVVKQNPEFRKKYGKELDLFIADRYTFISLTMLENNKKKESLKFLVKSFTATASVLVRKRFWAIAKKILLFA